jgi:hypothetical protein
MATTGKRKEVLVFGAAARTPGSAQLTGATFPASPVDVDTLRTNLEEFVNSLHGLLPQTVDLGGFGLTSFDVEVGIDTSGKVGFLGTGVEAGAHASLSLHFEKK